MNNTTRRAVEGLLVVTGIALFISCGNEQRYEKHTCTIDGVIRDCRIPLALDGTSPDTSTGVVIIVEPLPTVQPTTPPTVLPTPTPSPKCSRDHKCKKDRDGSDDGHDDGEDE